MSCPDTPQIFSCLVSTKGLEFITTKQVSLYCNTICFNFTVIPIVPDYVYFFNKVCLCVCR